MICCTEYEVVMFTAQNFDFARVEKVPGGLEFVAYQSSGNRHVLCRRDNWAQMKTQARRWIQAFAKLDAGGGGYHELVKEPPDFVE